MPRAGLRNRLCQRENGAWEEGESSIAGIAAKSPANAVQQKKQALLQSPEAAGHLHPLSLMHKLFGFFCHFCEVFDVYTRL